MSHIICAAFCLIYISVAAPAPSFAQEQQSEDVVFFSSINDIPVRPGLVELPDQTLVFDKPEGRIIESIAQIEYGLQGEISRYYEQTLPQFGWQKNGEDSYLRNDEHLQLKFETFEGQRFLRLMIEPR